MMVALSLSMVMRLAVPRSSILTFSSLRPRSSVMALPPVRVAMSCSMALRRSPQPGALTAATCRGPPQFVEDQSGKRFAFHVYSNDQQGLGALGDLLE